ncbi:MAG: hypothetical protein QXV64_01580 [Candidatus Anstonellaceae archaeon]
MDKMRREKILEFSLIFFSLFFLSLSLSYNLQRPLEQESFIILDLSNFLSSGEIKAKAFYYASNFSEKKEGNFSRLSQQVSKIPATGALVSFYINDQPITDENGNIICQKIEVDEKGEAICKKALYILSPFKDKKVLKVWDLNTDLIITAKLEKSQKLPLIKSSFSEPFLISSGKSFSSSFFLSIKNIVSSPSALPTCILLFIIGGLFFASMFYQGRNPFSVFDITVPLIPNVGNPRVKPATVPANLSMMRKEVMFQTRKIELMMRLSKKFLTPQDARVVDRLLNRLKTKASLSPQEYATFREQLSQIAQRVPKIRRFYLDALDAWQALVAQLESIAAARAGPGDQRSFLYKLTSNAGKGLAKVTSKFPFLRYVDYLPFVYRVRMVITNWIASREASRYLTRSLLKGTFQTTIARTYLAQKIGLSRLFSNYNPDNSVVGYIPNIVDKFRLKTYKTADALIQQYASLFIFSIYTHVLKDKKLFDRGALQNHPELAEINGVLQRLYARAAQAANNTINRERLDPNALERLTNIYFLEELANYIIRNKIPLNSLTGERFFNKQVLELFLKDLNAIRSVIIRDISEANSLGQRALLEDGSVRLSIRGFNPDSVFERYNILSSIVARHAKTTEPLVLIGKSLVEFFENIFTTQNLDRDREIRYAFILRKIEEETLKTRYIRFLLGQEAVYQSANLPLFQRQRINSPLAGGDFNTWFSRVQQEVSSTKIAQIAEYDKALEWAARRFISGFWRSNTTFGESELRAKILRLSDYYSFIHGGGSIDLFDKFDNNYRKDLLTYYSLRESFNFFFPNARWGAEGFDFWLQRGVLFEDLKRAIFINNAKMELLPLPSSYSWNKEGYVNGASISTVEHKNRIFMFYNLSQILPVLFGSDYAERLVGAKFVVNTRTGFKIGTISDPDFIRIWNAIDSEAKKFVQISQFSREGEKMRAFRNLEQLSRDIDRSISLVSTGYILEGGRNLPNLNNETINVSRFSELFYNMMKFSENIFVGGTSLMSSRLQEWYAAQAYARMVLYNFTQNYNRGLYTYSEEEKREAGLTTFEDEKLFKKYEKELQGTLGPGRFDTQGLLNRFFNVVEQTVMRDPRITYGSGYGLDPAIMSGYPTGQYYPEHPRLFSFYEGIPGSRLAYPFIYISYEIGRLFAILNRPFFTLTTGYTTAYRYDPEYGFLYGHHEKPSFFQAIRSLFKPSYNFDVPKIVGDMLSTVGIKLGSSINNFSFRSYISDLEFERESSRFFSPIGRFLRDGYYVIENRTGRDITTAGGLHRPYELTAAWEIGSVVKRTLVPGKIYYDWEERWQLYPFAAFNFTHPLQGGPLNRMRIIQPQLESLARAGRVEQYFNYSGLGTNFAIESNMDMYKINTSLITEYHKIQLTIQSFGPLNSPFVFPIAPIPVLGWQILKRNIPAIRNQPYSSLPPTRGFSSALTPQEALNERLMREASSAALNSRRETYFCPIHNIELRAGTLCPICRTQEEAEAQRFSNKLRLSISRKFYSISNTIKAFNPFIADHFLNTVYCPIHHIPFEKGTVCPICANEKLRRQENIFNLNLSPTENMSVKDIIKEFSRYEKRIERIIKRKDLSEQQKLDLIEILKEEKESLARSYNLIDELDRNYNYKLAYERLYYENRLIKRKTDNLDFSNQTNLTPS